MVVRCRVRVVLVVKEMEDDEMVCLRMLRNGEGGELDERGMSVIRSA
jgi:hypothetical protein